MEKANAVCPFCGTQLTKDNEGHLGCPACGYREMDATEPEVDTVRDLGKEEAERVKAYILGLPEYYAVTLGHYDRVREIRRKYDALKIEQKKLIENVNKLLLAEEALELLMKEPAKKVDYLITILPEVADLTLADKEKVQECEKAFDELDDRSKPFVTCADKLRAAHEKMEILADPDYEKKQKKAAKELKKKLRQEARRDMSEEAKKRRAKQRKKVIGTSVIVFVLVSAIVAATLFATGVVTLEELEEYYFHAFITPSGDLEYELSEDGRYYVVTGAKDKNVLSVSVPERYNGKVVSEIAPYAFKDYPRLREVIMADSVSAVGDGAFSGCKVLKYVSLSCVIRYVGFGAFDGCDSLKYNMYNDLCYLGDEEYLRLVLVRVNNKDIQDVVLSNETRVICSDCFAYCENLRSVVFGSAPLTSVMNGAFAGCTSLQTFEMPSGNYQLGTGVFDGCDDLLVLTVEQGKYWGSINNCLYDKRDGKVMACATGTPVFETQFDWEDLDIYEIGNWCCYGRKDLTAVYIPEGVKTISEGAFAGCSELTTIALPSSIRMVSESAFSGCTALTEITFEGTSDEWEIIAAGISLPDGIEVTCLVQTGEMGE